MTEENIKEFKKELLLLLDKYNVSIGFTCSDSSDTHGLYNDHIIVQENATRENIIEADGWWLTGNDSQ